MIEAESNDEASEAAEGATVVTASDGAKVDLNEVGDKEATVGSDEFTKDSKKNMWDAIRTEESEEDLDVPPTLRSKFRRKKKE